MNALQKDESGKWIEAQIEEYHPWRRKILCFIGWHEWSFMLERTPSGFRFPEKPNAKCIWCKIDF